MDWRDILIWILFVISIAVVLWYFFGSSPTLIESLVVLMITLMFISNTQVIKNSIKLNFVEKDLKGLKNSVKEGFGNIKGDIDLIKKKLKI